MRAALHFWVPPQIAFHRPQPFHPPARSADLPVEGPPGRCQSVPSALARGYPLAQGVGNPAAPDWAGANAPALGQAGADGFDAGQIHQEKVGQARVPGQCPDLTRVKSIKKRWGRRGRRGSAPT
jgi:hypothetical protein